MPSLRLPPLPRLSRSCRAGLCVAAAGAVLALAPAARAACSRPIVVPASSLGKMMVVDGARGQAWGIYPDLLRSYGAKAGCTFVFPVVPRARAEVLLQKGEADLLLGAVKVSQRDAWGDFVPMLGSDWVLVSRSDTSVPVPASVQALLDLPNIKFNAVRGFNAGPAYLALLAGLELRGALEYVNDAQTIVRKMAAGRADFTVMPAHTFAGALAEMAPAGARPVAVHYSRLDGLPPAVIGVYLSKRLDSGDAAELTALLQRMRAANELMTGLRRYFTDEEMISNYVLPALPAPAPGHAGP